MWDIKNQRVAKPLKIWLDEYYLNHVGYKGSLNNLNKCFGAEYYLNHVGYKDIVIIIIFLWRFGYYLNHVGYKGYEEA